MVPNLWPLWRSCVCENNIDNCGKHQKKELKKRKTKYRVSVYKKELMWKLSLDPPITSYIAQLCVSFPSSPKLSLWLKMVHHFSVWLSWKIGCLKILQLSILEDPGLSLGSLPLEIFIMGSGPGLSIPILHSLTDLSAVVGSLWKDVRGVMKRSNIQMKTLIKRYEREKFWKLLF